MLQALLFYFVVILTLILSLVVPSLLSLCRVSQSTFVSHFGAFATGSIHLTFFNLDLDSNYGELMATRTMRLRAR